MSAGGAAEPRPAIDIAPSRPVLLFLLSIFIVLVGVYPSSPVLILLLGGDPTTGFIICTGFTLVLLHAVMEKGASGRHTRILRWTVAAVAAIIALKIIFNYASLAVRELMLTGICWYAVGLTGNQLRAILRNVTYILAILLTISLLAAVISYYLGIGDYAAWNVDYLHYLSQENPLARRSREGVYVSFYMPYYLAVIPAYNAQEAIGFGLEFQRQNLIFSEWSYLSFFIAPLMFYVWGDRGVKAHGAIMAIFVVSFVLTLSVWGVVAVAGTLFLLALGKVTKAPEKVVMVGLIALAILVSVMGTSGILGALGGNKLEQFYTYFGDKFDLTKLISPFGVGAEAYLNGGFDEGFRYYGVLNIALVYGIAGLVAYCAIGLLVLFLAGTALRRGGELDRTAGFSAISMVLVIVLGVKLTYLIPLFLFLFAALLARGLDAGVPRSSAKTLPR